MWYTFEEKEPTSGKDVIVKLVTGQYYVGQWSNRSSRWIFEEFFVPKEDVQYWTELPEERTE